MPRGGGGGKSARNFNFIHYASPLPPLPARVRNTCSIVKPTPKP